MVLQQQGCFKTAGTRACNNRDKATIGVSEKQGNFQSQGYLQQLVGLQQQGLLQQHGPATAGILTTAGLSAATNTKPNCGFRKSWEA
jgi:hypothetical protein